MKIYNGYRYRLGAGTENFSFFMVVSEPVSEKFGTGKSLRTGIGKSWYRKKEISEPVSEKFGTEEKYRYQYRKYFVPEISIGIGIV